MDDERYYYLLGGKEHGPLSRAAIENLMRHGKLREALLKSDRGQAWQSAEEFELAKQEKQPVQVDPASLVFRSAPAAKRGSGAKIVLLLAVLAISLSAAIVFYKNDTDKKARTTARNSPDFDQAIRSAGGVNSANGAPIAEEAIQLSAFELGVWTLEGRELIRDGRMPVGNTAGSDPDLGMYWRIFLPPESQIKDGKGYLALHRGKWRNDECILGTYTTGMISTQFNNSNRRDSTTGICIAGSSTSKRSASDSHYIQPHAISVGQPYEFTETSLSVLVVNAANAKKIVVAHSGDSFGNQEPAINPESITPIETVQALLEILRSKPLPESPQNEFQAEACCRLNKNSIEIGADREVFLYSNGSAYVVTYYWEDNHGNPHSEFYQLVNDSWRDVGDEVMPGYTGSYDDYLQATSDGITKWRSAGISPLYYRFRDGRFAQTQ